MSAGNRWPAIRVLLASRTRIAAGGAAAATLLVAWLAWRTGWPELYVLAFLAGAAIHFILRVAIEVVALVAETLMPQ